MMQRISIPVAKGESLATLLFPPVQKAKAAMIICHGFRGGKENGGQIFPFAQALNERGLLVAAFDFAGCGESSGEFSQITLSRQVRDLKQVSAYLQETYGLPQLVLGRSFGGSTALAAAPELQQVSHYLLWSTPFDLMGTFTPILGPDYERLTAGNTVTIEDETGSFELGPAFLSDMRQHNMSAYLQAIQDKPVLLVHGEADEVVPVENARQMAAKLINATLHIIPGADHRCSAHTKLRQDITLDWL